jgi:hypothetical protein
MCNSMLRELAEDETFWVALAGASTALVIALVIEARDARDNLDRLVLKSSRAAREAILSSEKETEGWLREFKLWEEGKGDRPGEPPKAGPLPPDDPEAAKAANAESRRVHALVIALWALSVSVLGSLVASLPIAYPGAVGDIGIVITLVAFLSGAVSLITATTKRITRSSSLT